MNVGVAGLGFMGSVHIAAWEQVSNATVTAVMSSDEGKLAGDLRAVGGNFGVAGRRFDFSKATKFTSFEELIETRDVDVIDICLPSHLHAATATRALRAGKHVLVEKPIALSGAEGDKLLRMAEASGRMLMCGHVLRFINEYKTLAGRVNSAAPVRSAFFRRRTAAPNWSGWLTDKSKSGGAILDLLIHDIDFCLSVWGTPKSVRCRGHEDLTRGIDISHISFEYPELGPVEIVGGWYHPRHYPFSMEFTVVTDEATYDWKSGSPMTLYPAEGEAVPLPISESDPFAAELAYFAECIDTGTSPEFCLPAQSVLAVKLTERVRESRRRGGSPVLCKI